MYRDLSEIQFRFVGNFTFLFLMQTQTFPKCSSHLFIFMSRKNVVKETHVNIKTFKKKKYNDSNR